MLDNPLIFNEISSFNKEPDLIGITICINEHNHTHCGIAYKINDQIYILHLAFHHILLNTTLAEEEQDNTRWYWVKPRIHAKTQLYIANLCPDIFKNSNAEYAIPYALNFKKSTFSSRGTFQFGEDEFGFTCATFILAIFLSSNIKLVDVDNWPKRDSDAEFHSWVVKMLENWKVEQSHINNVRLEVGNCPRFRPEEVAVSSIFKIKPCESSVIWKHGEFLKKNINPF